MIFVTLGTQDKTFKRLLIKIDELIDKGIIQGEVIVQAGKTSYQSNHMMLFTFCSQEQLNQYVEECDYMITHAGVGSIINGINHQKKVIAVARKNVESNIINICDSKFGFTNFFQIIN